MSRRSTHPARFPLAVAGFLAAASITCSDGTGPAEPAYALEVTAAGATTLTALGQNLPLTARLTRDDEPFEGPVAWTSRSSAVATVSGTGLVSAVNDGTAWIVASGPEETRDSILVTVGLLAAQVAVSPSTIVAYVGGQVQLSAVAQDRFGSTLPGQVSWSTQPAGILSMTPAGLLTALQAGSASVLASYGATIGNATAYVFRQPVLSFAPGATLTVGVGQYATVPVLSDTTLVRPLAMPVGTTDAAVAAARDSARVGIETTAGSVQVAGFAPGSATLRIQSFGTATSPLAVTVTPARLLLAAGGPPPVPLAQATLGMVLNTTQALVTLVGSTAGHSGLARVAPLEVRVRSSDTLVAKLSDTVLTIAAQSGQTPQFTLSARGAGRATITTTAPGHAPDSFHVSVSAPRLRITDGNVDVGTQVVGAGQRLGTSLSIEIPPALRTAPFTIAVAQKHPERVRVVSTIDVPLGASAVGLRFDGLGTGADTLVVSAPGAEPDTIVAIVGTPRLVLGMPSVNEPGMLGTLSVAFGDSTGGMHALLRPRTLFFSSLDDALAAVTSPRLRVDSGAITATVPLEARGTGRTAIAVADSAALFLPDTTEAFDVRLRQFGVRPHFVLGPRQLAFGRFAFPVGVSYHTVAIRNESPALLRLPAEVRAYGFEDFTIETLADTGTGRAILSAPGFQPETLVIAIRRAPLGVATSAELPPAGPRFAGSTGKVLVWARSPDDSVNAWQNEDVVIALTSTDTSVLALDQTTVTLPALAGLVEVPLRFVGAGTARIVAVDVRGDAGYAPDTSAVVEVIPARLVLTPSAMSLGVGQSRRVGLGKEPPTPLPPIVWTHSDSTVTQVVQSAVDESYSVVGRRTGVDTLIVTADSHEPDTMVVSVGKGRFAIELMSTSPMRAGDSVRVAIHLRGPDGSVFVSAAEAVTLTLSTTPSLQAGDASGAAVSTVAVESGSSTSAFFFLKTLAAGEHTLTVTHPDYEPASLTLSVEQ